MQSNVTQLQEEAEAQNRAAAIRRLDENTGSYAPAATLETERVPYRTSLKEKLKLGVNLNNVLEEIVEMRVKWLALLVLGTAAIGATTMKLIGEKPTPPAVATNTNTPPAVASSSSSSAVQQPSASVVTINKLAKEWTFPNSGGYWNISGNTATASGTTKQSYRVVGDFYARKCGQQTFNENTTAFGSDDKGIVSGIANRKMSGAQFASFTYNADRYNAVVYLEKPGAKADVRYTIRIAARRK